MAKLTLNPAPTFSATVDIPLHGGGSAPVKFTFKHRTKAALAEWRDAIGEKSDGDLVMEMAMGWDLDDEFNRENVDRLLEGYAGAGREVFTTYLREILQAKAKN